MFKYVSVFIRFHFFEELLEKGPSFFGNGSKTARFSENRQNRPHLAGFFDKNTSLAVFRRIIRIMACSSLLGGACQTHNFELEWQIGVQFLDFSGVKNNNFNLLIVFLWQFYFIFSLLCVKWVTQPKFKTTTSIKTRRKFENG